MTSPLSNKVMRDGQFLNLIWTLGLPPSRAPILAGPLATCFSEPVDVYIASPSVQALPLRAQGETGGWGGELRY